MQAETRTRQRYAAASMLLCAVAAPLLPISVRADTGVVDVSNTPTRPEGEESIAVNPANPDDVVVGSNALHSNFDLTDDPTNPNLAPCVAWVSHNGAPP